MSWANTTIGQHCTVTSSKRFHLSERSQSGVPFYCSKEIIQKCKGEEITQCDYIHEEFYNEVAEKFGVPQTNDLLVTTRGTIGIPYLYRDTDRFYFADGNLTWMKDFEETLLPQYLFYWFQSHEGQKKVDAIAKGTAQKAVPISGIKTLALCLPPIDTQRRMVDILSAYDNLIENNQKQIKLLEEAAQRLYIEWFVDLHFSGHEDTKIVEGMPDGWEKCTLGEIVSYEIGGGWGEESPSGKCEKEAYVIRGTDLYGLTHGNSMSIPNRYHAAGNLSARALIDGDIVFEVSGGSKTEGVARAALIRRSMLESWKMPVMCASFCKLIRCSDNRYSQYLFDHIQYLRSSGKTTEYDKRSASSIVNFRWKDFLVQENILIPDDDTIRCYNAIAENVYNKIITCSQLIEKATQARDRLIPNLMSGELEV